MIKLEEHVGLAGNWYSFILVPSSVIRFEMRKCEFDRNLGRKSSFSKTIIDYGEAVGLEAARLAGYGYLAYRIYESLK